MATRRISVFESTNGRTLIKCTPNTLLMTILEESCEKLGLEADLYELKHHERILDMSSTFGLSGLPNHAQLELVFVKIKRVETDVTIAIELANGKRVMGTFHPDTTLWDVLTKLCTNDLTDDLVLIHMPLEIRGKDLKSKTLKSIGLRRGRAMLRLIHKKTDGIEKETEKMDNQPNLVQKDKKEPVFKHPMPLPMRQEETREKRKLPENAPLKEEMPSTKVTIKEDKTQQDQVKPDPPTAENDVLFLNERNAMIFSMESADSIPCDELPDDFFDLTIDDAKLILRDIRKRRREFENAPLVTSVYRERETKKKRKQMMKKYKKTIIRVLFPDRMILQGLFEPTESIDQVKEFVKLHLEDRNLKFHLFITPPKTVLKETSRLMEIGCVPAALLHFGVEESEKNEKLLKRELVENITTNSAASLATTKLRKEAIRSSYMDSEEKKLDDNLDEPVQELDGNLAVPGTSHDTTDQSEYQKKEIVKSDGKVPKWFRPH